MKKILLGVVLGAGFMFGGYTFAKYMPDDVPAFVDVIKSPDGWNAGRIFKMYDPYTNIVCYETYAYSLSSSYDISCLSLK